jgi:hypothetical protein
MLASGHTGYVDLVADLLLPQGARLIHIGPHKTGSTAVQVALFEARDELASMGVFYPGGSRRRRRASEQLLAAVQEDGSVVGPLRRWRVLVEEVAAAGAVRACVSDERFGKAPDHVVPRIIADLGGDDAHVVAVARNYEALLPSQWQERVKAGYTGSYDAWLEMVLTSGKPQAAKDVWHAHDTPALVERWVRHVGPERFTLVVADESDRRHLLTAFEQLLGIPDGFLRADPDQSNRSLHLAEIELVRALNLSHRSRQVADADYRRLVAEGVGAVMQVAPEVRGPRRPVLPAWAVPLVRARSEARVEALRTTDVRVVGDLGHLLPSEGLDAPVDSAEPWISAAGAGTVAGEVLHGISASGLGDQPSA